MKWQKEESDNLIKRIESIDSEQIGMKNLIPL